jgi:hypothetical protein
MSEREFLELLNLYLDREITAADADRLEKEIRSDAGRHRTYLQYCRMQQAMRLLGDAEGHQIEERSLAGRAPAPSVVREGWGSRWVWTGAVAAAAVVLLFLAARRPESASANQEDRLAGETLRRDPGTGGKPSTLGLSGDALLLSQFPSTGSVPHVHEDKFNWMRQFHLVSLDSRIGAQPLSPATVAPQPAAPAVPNRPAGEDATEMAAFKFVK